MSHPRSQGIENFFLNSLINITGGRAHVSLLEEGYPRFPLPSKNCSTRGCDYAKVIYTLSIPDLDVFPSQGCLRVPE